MTVRSFGACLLLALAVTGCGSGAPGGSGTSSARAPSTTVSSSTDSPSTASPTPSITACATEDPDPLSSAAAAATGCPSSAGGGGGGGDGAGGAGGGPGATVTRTWNEAVTQLGDGTSSLISERYEAVASLTLTKVDIGSWTISGWADITSSFTSDYRSHTTTSLGPCDTHYTDDASGGGRVAVAGGLEARDGFYQFYVDIPGLDGTNATVRDDSGCHGPNNAETVTWPIGPTTAGGSGDFTGATFSGRSSEPRTGGEDTTTWSFTIDP